MAERNDNMKHKSKARGALIGLAIGDSFGDAARMQSNRVDYGVTTDFNSGASWSTDDTEFAMLTAKTLVRCGGKLTAEEVVKSWFEDVVVQDEFKRGGASEIEAANNLRIGLRPPESGKFNTYHMSDGTAMRIPPVGIVCAGDPEKAARLAAIDASISHYSDGVYGAQAVAAAVAVAMTDATMDEILDTAISYMPKDSWLYANMMAALEIIEKANGSLIDSWMPLHDRLRTSKWATTAEAIPSTFACLKLAGDEFKRGVIVAGNFGRDADTIGAVTGAVLGAKFGIEAIPDKWVQKVRYPSGTCLQFTKGIDILDMADKLAEIKG